MQGLLRYTKVASYVGISAALLSSSAIVWAVLDRNYFHSANWNWQLIVDAIGHLAWPVTTLLLVMLGHPMAMNLLAMLNRNGGKLLAFGGGIEVNAEGETKEAAMLAGVEPAKALSKEDTERREKYRTFEQSDLYYEVIAAWGLVADAISNAYREKTKEELDWRSGWNSLNKAVQRKAITSKMFEAADSLFKVRASAKRRGPNGFSALGMDAEDVLTYVRTANQVAIQIAKAN